MGDKTNARMVRELVGIYLFIYLFIYLMNCEHKVVH